MLETTRLNGPVAAIELDFVERVSTPKRVMKFGIHPHLAELSLSNTVSVLEKFGLSRVQSTVHNWVQKSDLRPRTGREPDYITLVETVVKVNGERYWFYAAVEPETNEVLHVRLYPTRTIVVTKLFLRELREKHSIEEAECFVDGAPWLQGGFFESVMHFQHETPGDRNPVERIYQEI